MHLMFSRIVSCQFFRGLSLLRFPTGLQSLACTLYSQSFKEYEYKGLKNILIYKVHIEEHFNYGEVLSQHNLAFASICTYCILGSIFY